MARTKLIAANWKMNKTVSESEAFVAELKAALPSLPACDAALFPPFFSVAPVARQLVDSDVIVGAQDVYYEKSGAFTGEISTAMIHDVGATHVLIGHSERRHVMGEDNDIVHRKLRAALDGGLIAVLCVGERLEDREAGAAEDYVAEQLATAFEGFDKASLSATVVAYEPVWAIGTGKTATPDDAEAMHRFVRGFVAERFDAAAAADLRILYGGSVKPDNAADLLSRDEIDGALIGGASLEAQSFIDIARAST